MKRTTVTFFLLSVLIYASGALAADMDTTGAFTRGGWAGAEYVATGSAAESSADDVFALYWNPAGLASLASHNTKSPDDIRKKAASGSLDGITEEDLIRFSDTRDSFFFQAGASASSLDMDRNAVFCGAAFRLFGGVFGAGAMSVYSGGIAAYDENMARTGTESYSATEGFLSYGRSFGVASFGVTLKPIYEKVADAAYSGGACDIGVLGEVLPFIHAGFVFQDILLGEYPVSGKGLEKEWHMGSGTMRSSVSIDSRAAGLSVSGGFAYRMEQERFIFNVGAQYGLNDAMSLAIGLSGSKLRSGIGCSVWGCELWYAFSVDSINSGYDNTVSLAIML
jgi:hypothetical protein